VSCCAAQEARRIPLRTDVIFHNGLRLTAPDAVASLQRWMRLSALGQAR
jgi:MarR-like DNA-binding transcriptional regulator SgrR of sgrS sRNA